MRAMPIRVYSGSSGWKQLKAAFRKNKGHYLQEGLGLAIFMVSACFFGAMLYADNSPWHQHIHSKMFRDVLMGLAMGGTALFIFYSPFTAPSGSQINPAVTLTFLRLDKMCRYDALFYILFQFLGGTAAVFLMQSIMGSLLTAPPVNSVTTVPGKAGAGWAIVTEFLCALVTMSIGLFTQENDALKKYTRVFASGLVCCWVIFAGPVSGFGMNPARSFASALPSGIWNHFWIYLLAPVAGMFTAAELFQFVQRKKLNNHHPGKFIKQVRKKFNEPLEFML